jgi:hypothetical protein
MGRDYDTGTSKLKSTNLPPPVIYIAYPSYALLDQDLLVQQLLALRCLIFPLIDNADSFSVLY